MMSSQCPPVVPQQSPTLYFRGACRLAGLPEPGETQ
jgi:hypothetical protein